MSGRSADTRESIRRAAYQCFRDHGYHESSVDAICRAAAVSKGSFYYHYPSKQACFVDILDTWTREVISEVQMQFEEAVRSQNPFAALQAAFRRENLRGRLIVPLWLEFSILARREPAIRSVLARFYHRARLAIAEMLRPYVGPLIAPEALDGLSNAIFGVYFGCLIQELVDPENTEANAASDAVLDLLARMSTRMSPAAAVATQDPRPAARRPPEGARIEDRAFDSFVASSSGPVRQTMAELRELVHATAPGADERVIRGWRVIAYDHDGLFCSLKPKRAHVDLGFNRGAALDDPHGLLVGTGKHARHVRVAGDFDRDAVVALVAQAHALQDRAFTD